MLVQDSKCPNPNSASRAAIAWQGPFFNVVPVDAVAWRGPFSFVCGLAKVHMWSFVDRRFRKLLLFVKFGNLSSNLYELVDVLVSRSSHAK